MASAADCSEGYTCFVLMCGKNAHHLNTKIALYGENQKVTELFYIQAVTGPTREIATKTAHEKYGVLSTSLSFVTLNNKRIFNPLCSPFNRFSEKQLYESGIVCLGRVTMVRGTRVPSTHYSCVTCHP